MTGLAHAKKRQSWLHGLAISLKRDWRLYLMMILPVIFYIMFRYTPMHGIVIAFQNYNLFKGIAGSQFVGMANFEFVFKMRDFSIALQNTLLLNFLDLIVGFPVPIILSIMLNEIKSTGIKRVSQTLLYLPHFLSWVILAKIVLNIFGYTGPINQILGFFGQSPVQFFGEPSLFRPLVIGTDVWKSFGYNTVIYLAAILGIDPTLYEAAAVDGAGRFRRIWHITLPGIRMTVALLAILALGNVLNAGFDQIYNLYNPLVYSTGDIIDTWVYRYGLQNLQFSLATTVGLFKSVISLILITLGYWLADKFTGYKLF